MAVLATVGLVATVGVSASAVAASTAEPEPAPPHEVAADDIASSEVLHALRRDLDLTLDEAKQLLIDEKRAISLGKELRSDLSGVYGGAWIDADTELVVATTDRAEAELIRAAGATAKVVSYTETQLTDAVAELDANASDVPDAVTSWYVDVETNQVVIRAGGNGLDAAADFAASSGLDQAMVRVEASSESPRPLAQVRGGAAYFINNSARCSIGFPVRGGFVTAGHCGSSGDSTQGHNGAAQGTVRGSVFPGNDMGWVRTNSDWSVTNKVKKYPGKVTVAGSRQAAVGASICRSGSTTGWHCGRIQAKHVTVSYPQGQVQNLTRTNVCAEPGDSGGSWLSGRQAQGVTSGGSGNCSSGGTTFFQPLRPILNRWDLTLRTG